MSLVTTTEMFKKAYDGGYAIGAFNVNNMEIVQGITEAAGELNSPVILQVSKGARAYANHTYLVKLVEAAVIENPQIPIALHLDHGDSFELCKSCIDGGFTSVMIDASSKSFEDNIALTKQVVEYAHAHGVVVEAELGTLAGIEDEVVVEAGSESYTRPEELQSEHLMVLISSLLISVHVMQMVFLFHLHFVLMFWKNVSKDFQDFLSFFTDHLQFRRNSFRWLTSLVEICQMQLVFRKMNCVMLQNLLYVRLISTQISVLP